MVRRFAVFALFLGGVGYAASRAGEPPSLAANCEKTELNVVDKDRRSTLSLRYSFTGPKDRAYVVAVDAQAVQVTGDTVTVTPRQASVGGSRPHSEVIRPDECRGKGMLSVLEPEPGERRVTVFAVDGSGRGVSVAEETVTLP